MGVTKIYRKTTRKKFVIIDRRSKLKFEINYQVHHQYAFVFSTIEFISF